MPTYELFCRDCQATFEVVESVAEYERDKRENKLACEQCGSTEVLPQIAVFEVQTTRKSA